MIEGDQSGGLVNRGYLTMPLSFYRRGCRRLHRHIAHVALHGRCWRCLVGLRRDRRLSLFAACGSQGGERSEEHTSELQSLMRISYAVFCLKKKKNTTNK